MTKSKEINTGKKWSKEEAERNAAMRRHGIGEKNCAGIQGRSMDAVRSRNWKTKVGYNKPHTKRDPLAEEDRTQAQYTKDEDKKMLLLNRNSRGLAYIAEELGRTEKGIKARLKRLAGMDANGRRGKLGFIGD